MITVVPRDDSRDDASDSRVRILLKLHASGLFSSTKLKQKSCLVENLAYSSALVAGGWKPPGKEYRRWFARRSLVTTCNSDSLSLCRVAPLLIVSVFSWSYLAACDGRGPGKLTEIEMFGKESLSSGPTSEFK
eukprot:g40267.t1